MAKKEKSAAPKKGPGGDLEKALDGLQKAAKELDLHIKSLKKLKGHPFLSGGTTGGARFTS